MTIELADAIQRLIPLQVRLPNRYRPLTDTARYAAELYLALTSRGRAVIWLDGFWCDKDPLDACHIAYAQPQPQAFKLPGTETAETLRWIDNHPRWGPHCIPYQRPVIIEPLSRGSPAWPDYTAWRNARGVRGVRCNRSAGWEHAKLAFGTLIQQLIE
jgi:hypothetical protein